MGFYYSRSVPLFPNATYLHSHSHPIEFSHSIPPTLTYHFPFSFPNYTTYIHTHIKVQWEKREYQIPIGQADHQSTVHSEALHLTKNTKHSTNTQARFTPKKHRVTQQHSVHKSVKVTRFLDQVSVEI